MADEFSKRHARIRSAKEAEWLRRGREGALRLFHKTARGVPAYKKFLKRNGVNPRSIRTISDFKLLPLVTKENYLRAYPLHELVPKGDLAERNMISASSGSSGVPFFLPRGTANTEEAAIIHELFLVDFFNIDKKRTLFVNTFAMGMWVAGTTTYESLERIAAKHPLTLVAPGIELEQVVSAVKSLGGFYDQVILAGYPPFIKDVIDAGTRQGVRWKDFSVRFLFAAESFSEDWRDEVHRMAGIPKNIFGSLNIYGTADALIVAHETPLSIAIRRAVTGHKSLHTRFFGGDLRVPTLAQYDPSMRYIEELPDSQIIFSAGSGIPLIRYDIGDRGNILGYEDIARMFAEEGVPLFKGKGEREKIQRGWHLPFVTIYGRDKMVASFYGLKIYPEHVRGALEKSAGNRFATGRFVMHTNMEKGRDQRFKVHVELHENVRADKKTARHIEELIFRNVQVMNSEYKRLVAAVGEKKARPLIVLHHYRSSALFDRAGKQRWKS